MNRTSDRDLLVIGLAGIVLVLVGTGLFINVGSYSVTIGAVVGVVLMVISQPIFRRLGGYDDDDRLARLLSLALAVKLISSVARYFMVNKFYGGAGDSVRYAREGWEFAQAVRSGSLFPSIESIDTTVDGTRQISKFTGYVFSITGPSLFAGFFVFSWLAFMGCLLFARGMKTAFPESDHKRYLYLVLFWPSLLFWPSAIGKDALMVFCLGVATYGACQVLAPRARFWGLAPFALGVLGMLQIRAHVALMAVLAIVVATTFAFIGGQHVENAAKRGRIVRMAGLVVMVLMALTAATQTTRFFSEEAGQATSTTGALEMTVKRTQQGGSEFQPIVVTSPAQIPAATVSVLFRPFPWEVNSAGALLSAVEGLAVLGLFVVSWKRLRRWPISAWRRPVLLYGVIYTLMFVVAFSSIGNAGILARQRTQLLPLLFMAFAVPTNRWWRDETRVENAHRAQSTPLGERASDTQTDEQAEVSQELVSR